MSSAKRFEKTFSRKKDNNNDGDKYGDGDDDLDQVICSLPANPDNPNPNQKRKNVAISSSNLKQKQPKQQNLETQKQKRKVENSEGKTEIVKKKKKKSTQIQKAEEEEAVKKVETSECTFPTARISRIIKSEGSDYRLSQETLFLINKATEKFIGLFSNDAYDCAAEEHKNYIAYKHLSKAVSQEKRFDFLSDFVPDKVTAEKALAERKPTET